MMFLTDKSIYDDEMLHELILLFDFVGCDGYIQLMFEKLSSSTDKSFSFNELEKLLIDKIKLTKLKKSYLIFYSFMLFYDKILMNMIIKKNRSREWLDGFRKI